MDELLIACLFLAFLALVCLPQIMWPPRDRL